MKAVLSLVFLFSANAFATVDALTTVYLVMDDYNSEQYLVKPMTFSGCYGIQHGPQAATFAKPFLTKIERGCGGVATEEDINALSCANAEYDYGKEYDKVHGVTVDLAGCQIEPARLKAFKKAIKRAAKLNFGANVKLTIK